MIITCFGYMQDAHNSWVPPVERGLLYVFTTRDIISNMRRMMHVLEV